MVNMFKPIGYSLKIFQDRHAFNSEESWNDACLRVAIQMSIPESTDKQKFYLDRFFEMLVENYFMPGGRIWYGSGRLKPSLLNCFVMRNDIDSREGWAGLAHDVIVTSMAGGGCGLSFSDIRPRDSQIAGQSGTCPGPMGLMNLINNLAEPIRSGGSRRVAMMGSLSLSHPDIVEFLNSKLNDNQLTYMNISVISEKTKEFINAIRNNERWELNWKNRYKSSIDANHLWNIIATNAYHKSEPGLLNMQLAEDESPISYISNLVTVNPCFTGDMLLKTVDGFKTFEDLNNKKITLINKDGVHVKGSVWCNGIKDVISINLTSGEKIKCTQDHKFMTTDGKTCTANKLINKRIMPFIDIQKTNDEYTKLGYIQGDGNLTRLNSPTHKGIEINIGYKDLDIANLFNINYDKNKRSYYINNYNDILIKLKFISKVLPERHLPTTFKSWTIEQQLSFIRGLFSANGCVIKNKRISFKTTCKRLVEELLEFLNNNGIDCYITTNKTKNVKFKNGTYKCKESYDLNICKYQSILVFAKTIGFVHKYKVNALIGLIKHKSPMVKSITKIGQTNVYDFNLQDNTHWGVIKCSNGFSGYIAHNCGELFMTSDESCCLGSLVLPRFVSNGEVDYDLLDDVISNGIRFLDNVLSVNYYPLISQKEVANKLRRVGLGVTGLADTLILLGYKYGSDEGNKFLDKLFRFISKSAYEASIMLAAERGMFPLCKPEQHIKTGFVERMPKKIKSLILEHGIRNCALLTCPPTGTISLVSGNCSAGIEPIFSPGYKRNYFEINERKSEIVLHPLFKQFVDEGNDLSNFVSARDLSIEQHLQVQSIIQRHVDGAISKTVNISENYPIEDFKKTWLEYLPLVKGTTFYRENSRGYVDKDGNILEPPLVALSVEDAKNACDNSTTGTIEQKCKSGVCEL